MAEFYLGQIIQGGWNFAPSGTALCNGQTLAIQQYTALFALLGTTFGGNGTTTFQLPNLQGRVPIHWGQGQGLSNYNIGQSAGSETETLLQTNMPAHNHTATFTSNNSSLNASGATPRASLQVPVAGSPLGHSFDVAQTGSTPAIYCPSGTATSVALGGLNVAGTVSLGLTGGSQPFQILQPYLAITFVIALVGIFPSRN
jgi:microcystin-dependent protein